MKATIGYEDRKLIETISCDKNRNLAVRKAAINVLLMWDVMVRFNRNKAIKPLLNISMIIKVKKLTRALSEGDFRND